MSPDVPNRHRLCETQLPSDGGRLLGPGTSILTLPGRPGLMKAPRCAARLRRSPGGRWSGGCRSYCRMCCRAGGMTPVSPDAARMTWPSSVDRGMRVPPLQSPGLATAANLGPSGTRGVKRLVTDAGQHPEGIAIREGVPLPIRWVPAQWTVRSADSHDTARPPMDFSTLLRDRTGREYTSTR